jgi:hypothetical protein
MSKFRNLLATGAVAALLGIGAAAVTTTPAEARTVCNRYGDCWHERNSYSYPPGIGIRYYGDDYRWRHRHGYHWRDHHEGRGYWRNGIWITF